MTLRVALLGAESTGKSTLSETLAKALAPARPPEWSLVSEAAQAQAETSAPAQATTSDPRRDQATNPAERGWRVAVVPETLREWCAREGRTPRADEQRRIMLEHHRRIEQAALHHDIVLCDTTALITAVYSRTVFGDSSLDAEALAAHATMDATLLTALDLPWVADGLQRDGEHARQPVDDALRELLLANGIAFSVISGHGAARAAQALAAIAPLLRGIQGTLPANAAPSAPNGAVRAPTQSPSGSFTRLLSQQAQASDMHAAAWSCACCSVPELERALARGATPFKT
jgi:nicotinamide riboside kinase